MSAYSVGRSEAGILWWENWTSPGGIPGVTFIRAATDEESILMNKIILFTEGPGDRERLRSMLEREQNKSKIKSKLEQGNQ